VRALDSQTLSITATCFQRDGDGRRAGLKIRSSQGGVGSNPTFGIGCSRRITPGLVVRQSVKASKARARVDLHERRPAALLLESQPGYRDVFGPTLGGADWPFRRPRMIAMARPGARRSWRSAWCAREPESTLARANWPCEGLKKGDGHDAARSWAKWRSLWCSRNLPFGHTPGSTHNRGDQAEC
jgi:hypothetical protein